MPGRTELAPAVYVPAPSAHGLLSVQSVGSADGVAGALRVGVTEAVGAAEVAPHAERMSTPIATANVAHELRPSARPSVACWRTRGIGDPPNIGRSWQH
jgi:hypothetical protein